MPLNIPQSVFDKYYDIMDSTFDIFGVTCQLVTVKKEEVIVNVDNNLPVVNTINNRRGGGTRNVETKSIREIEVLTDIKLKVYWDQREWIGVTDNIQVPDSAIQTIAKMSDLSSILKARQLIVHKGIKDYKEIRFVRHGEHIPIGIKSDRYFGCIWKRV